MVNGLEFRILNVKEKKDLEDYKYLLERERKKKEKRLYEITKNFFEYSITYGDVILAYYFSRSAGFITGEKNGEEYISTMVYVLPEYRRKGIAQELKREQIRLARSLGCEKITTRVNKDNEASLRLQRGMGFTLELEGSVYTACFDL